MGQSVGFRRKCPPVRVLAPLSDSAGLYVRAPLHALACGLVLRVDHSVQRVEVGPCRRDDHVRRGTWLGLGLGLGIGVGVGEGVGLKVGVGLDVRRGTVAIVRRRAAHLVRGRGRGREWGRVRV